MTAPRVITLALTWDEVLGALGRRLRDAVPQLAQWKRPPTVEIRPGVDGIVLVIQVPDDAGDLVLPPIDRSAYR